ncbi:uncharacterized protein LOC135210161 isoform X2 [Macrobrachium nipponense]|uniref:uncharacterized protein LOC135210161 isoform X2 n=1 Tax=Macrobrachium nipponense TaxID=159736 RepID=UPI0030C7A986
MNKTYPKRRPRGRPKKRKSRERLQKHKEMSERDDEEEEIKTEADAVETQTEEDTAIVRTEEEVVKEVCSQVENNAVDTQTEEVPPVIDEETNTEIPHNEDESTTKENDDSSFPKEKITAVTQTENCAATTQTDDDINSFSAHLESNGVLNLKITRKEIKEEVKEEEEDEEEEEEDIEEPQPRASTLPFESSASTSTSPPEAVVAQLNQLQESVVSHILQYQAGVLAQFQQLQQQMLSEISSSNQPQVTVTPIVKREPNGRKRRSSSKFESSVSEEDNSKNGEVQSKRKRTAFSEKQYEILETTFQHNNFPEPIDQHCIALRIKTPYRSIKMWFQNRRASIRKRMMPKEKGTEEDTSEKKPAKNNCDPDTRWYCSVCPSTFISKKFLDAHTEAHKKETLRCANCSMSFTHKVLLDTHRISKCTSISGVDLSHLEDERKELNQSHDKINFIKALSNDPKSSESTCVSSAMLPLLLQKLQKHPKKESEISSPPPLIDPNSLNQVSLPKVENPVILQQQRLMQQLLLAQLQQAAQLKAKQESEDQDTAKETENANGSLTLGGLTIFPVKSSKPTIEIKEEPKSVEELSDLQPSTLHDQIANILENQGIKSSLKCEEDEDSKCGSRESMKEQIQAILRHQEEQRKKSLKTVTQGTGIQAEEAVDLESLRRHRRRTTVFNEVQLRTLYMHFTHCNFPDPAMFKIIGHLVKLDPQVIKIWFQNERSRQRKRAMHIVDEVSAKHKPYKCKDCGMSFAMMTFLVKHSMRHIGETDQDANVRTCPLCLQKWNKEVFSSHLKSRHNVNLSLVEERCPGSLKCYLCSESFPDQENLMIHKHKHLKDEYGDPPQCSKCKTTFVNAICLEAHMETHETGEWNHKCNLCDALFHDKVLLTSHEMGHGVPLAPVSTIDRSRSQLQHSNIRAINAIARKTVASAIESLNSSTESIEEQSSDNEVAKSEKSILSIKSSMLSKNLSPEHSIPTGTTSKTASTNTPTVSTVVATMTSPTVSTAPISNVITPPTGPVSYVKLIPVQLIPTNPVPSSQSGTPPAGVITGPTTAFLSVPVNFFGTGDASSNPVFSQIFDPSSSASKVSPDEKSNKKKSLPNLIPISDVGVSFIKKEVVEPNEEKTPVSDTKLENEGSKSIQAMDCVVKEKKEYVPDSASSVSEGEINEDNDEAHENTADATVSSHENKPLNDSQDTGKIVSAEVPPKTLMEDGNCESEDKSVLEGRTSSEIQSAQQLTSKKRYVPILPLLPLQLATKEPRVNSRNLTPETPVPQRPKSSRNVPNKRLWEAYKVDRYKRRRTPTYFSGSQREILEAHFDHDNFPDPGEQLAIADQLGVSYPVVKTWFQNTRKNFRKQLKFEKLIPAGGPFHCQKCNVAFISEVSLHEHSEVHNVVTGIKCQECDMSFSHQSVLKTHHAVTHKNAKLGEAIRRKKYGVDILERFSSSQGRFDGENEEVSDSDSPEEESEDGVTNGLMEIGSVKVERSMDDSLDGEDYHPIMAVECILDNSEGEDGVQKSEESSEQSGHKCCSCGESFASFIALKEHNSLHCASQGPLKPGHFRRRKKLLGKRRVIGNSIRCFDCYRVFPERNSYLEHFRTFPCSSNTSTKRIEYTDEEQRVLVTHYDGNNFPLPSEMSLLARRLGVRYRQVMHWFQNRRSKERKKIKEGGKLPPVECHRCKASFVTEESLSRHKKLAHGEVNNPGTEAEAETPLMEHACTTPGCGAFFPNEELLVTHSLAHQIDVDAVQTEEEEDDHKLPNLGPTTLWKDFAVLEAHYSDNNFPDPMDIGFIARRLQVDPLHVHLWFKERRKQHIRKLEENGTKVMEGETAVSTQKALSKVCSKCDAAFICQMDLDTHEDMHKSSWSQVCSMCGAEFSNVVVLETHWIRHGIEVKRQSPDRPTKASFSNAQMEVLDTHYEHNNFPMSLEIWLIAMRLNLRPRQVTHWFQNKRGRDRRVQKITTASSRICLHCGASFICDEFLEKHMQTHKIESRFTCSECKVVYLSAVLLETHSLYHTSIPKYRLPRRCNDGVRDPMTEGQVKNTSNLEVVEEQSDSSEGELRIDESENFTISIENNEDEHESEETEVLRGQDEAIDDGDGKHPGPESESFVEREDVEVSDDFTDRMDNDPADGERVTEDFELQSSDEKEEADTLKVNFANNKKTIREEVFFDDNSDSSDDDEDEPRLRIVSAYTISGNPEDMDSEEDL